MTPYGVFVQHDLRAKTFVLPTRRFASSICIPGVSVGRNNNLSFKGMSNESGCNDTRIISCVQTIRPASANFDDRRV